VGNAKPVRIGRILVFLMVWWALVRSASSAVMAAAMVLDQTGPITLANWRSHANPHTLDHFVRYFERSWPGSLPLIGTPGGDADDSLEYYFVAGFAPAISVVWALLLVTRIKLWRPVGLSGAPVVRGVLMSLVAMPIVYEATRLLGVLQSHWFTGPPDVVLFGILALSVVWMLVWWSATVRHALAGASLRLLAVFHPVAVLVGGAIHIGIYIVLE
jgi:hypothetical protein